MLVFIAKFLSFRSRLVRVRLRFSSIVCQRLISETGANRRLCFRTEWRESATLYKPSCEVKSGRQLGVLGPKHWISRLSWKTNASLSLGELAFSRDRSLAQ